MKTILQENIKRLQSGDYLTPRQLMAASKINEREQCLIVAQGSDHFYFSIEIEGETGEFVLELDSHEKFTPYKREIEQEWNEIYFAGLLLLKEYYRSLLEPLSMEGKIYTRAGMMQRVLKERQEKALKAEYKIEFANNIYGEHLLINEKGEKYYVTLRDFEEKTGYINNIDWKTNKLGTTKHILYVFHVLEMNRGLYKKLHKTYPFVEVYTDPLRDYQVTWYYPHPLPDNLSNLLFSYFGEDRYVSESNLRDLLFFIREIEEYDNILVRPEVFEKIDREYQRYSLMTLAQKTKLDLSELKVTPFPYQEAGISFTAFKKGAIIADDMGLGKTLQAIGAAIVKKSTFGFQKTLVICPASLKAQWKSEIERFTDQGAVVVEGTPHERRKIYAEFDGYFFITNYEAVLKDSRYINESKIDFLILDEAQRIKNFNTKTHSAIRRIGKKHALAITGTPIENKLLDLYSITIFLDPYFLTPLWEFSYQHCVFDPAERDKILGYYNLNALKERIKEILIRREKRAVLNELPNIRQIDVPVALTPYQGELHAGYASGVSQILRKKFKTPFDMQMLMHLLTNMRMVCDSSALVDDKSHDSPKLMELKHILTEKLNLPGSDRKVIIFSEWVKMNQLIGQMLRDNNIEFTELNGKVPVKHRGRLVKKFENDPGCNVFLSTEAGGAGLNLQVADTIINFELPWNPSKKNQRIGRIDRLGQKSEHLTVINLISLHSIEQKIAAGLVLKQNLFDGVLDDSADLDIVDFSEKGKGQFLKQLEQLIEELPQWDDLGDIQEEENELLQEINAINSLEDTQGHGKKEPREKKQMEKPAPGETPIPGKADQDQHGKIKEMEDVMNQGLGFLAGLYKMSTGQEMGIENQKIEIDEETGEVMMKFKLPGFK